MMQGPTNIKYGTIYCPDTSVTKYKSVLHNTPEDWRSPLHCAGSLGWRKRRFFLENVKGMPFPAALALVYQTAQCQNP